MGIYLGKNQVSVVGGRVGNAGISLQKKSVTPTEKKQIVTAESGFDGLSSVTVNAISSDYIGSAVEKKSSATYTPTTVAQTIAADQYLTGTQTIEGDSNLVSGNIKEGVSIFGVKGTMAVSSSSGEIDTSYVDQAISNHDISSTAHSDIRAILDSANTKISNLNSALNAANAEIELLKSLIETGAESNPFSVSFTTLDGILIEGGVWDEANGRVEF